MIKLCSGDFKDDVLQSLWKCLSDKYTDAHRNVIARRRGRHRHTHSVILWWWLTVKPKLSLRPDTVWTPREKNHPLIIHVAVLGFIPKSQNYFACSYSETCRKALTEFYQDGRVKCQSTDLPLVDNYTNQQLKVTRLSHLHYTLTHTHTCWHTYSEVNRFTFG